MRAKKQNDRDGWGKDGRRAQAQMLAAEACARLARTDPPRVGAALRPLLDILPPFIARKHVTTQLGLPITAGRLRDLDSLGQGPRVRCKDETSGEVMYPAAYLLEWVESRGFAVLASDRV